MPLLLEEAEFTLDFDPVNHTVTGGLQASTAAGGTATATFRGVLQGLAVQRLRERLARPDIVGEWAPALGTTCSQVTDRPGPPRVELDDPHGFLRLAPAFDLAVGLRGQAAGPVEFVALRRRSTRNAVAFGPDDRHALQFLARDLLTAGRPVEAIPLLDEAQLLIEKAAATARNHADSERISLISLLDRQAWCAFRLRDYPTLVARLRRAVALQEQLSSADHVADLIEPLRATLAEQLDSLTSFADQAEAHLATPAGRSDRSGPGFVVLATVLSSAVGILGSVRTADTSLTVDTVLNDQDAAAAALAELDRALVEGSAALRVLVPQCLTDDAELFAGATDEIRERDLIVAQTARDAAPDAETLADIEVRERDLEDEVRRNPTLSRNAASLLLIQAYAATMIRGAADALDVSRAHLVGVEPLASLTRRRQQSRQSASRLSAFIERWRGLLDEDWERILTWIPTHASPSSPTSPCSGSRSPGLPTRPVVHCSRATP